MIGALIGIVSARESAANNVIVDAVIHKWPVNVSANSNKTLTTNAITNWVGASLSANNNKTLTTNTIATFSGASLSATNNKTLTTNAITNWPVLLTVLSDEPTWDPANNFNGATLSADKLTMTSYTGYSASGGGNGARGTVGKTTGKWYFEYVPTQSIPSSYALGVGVTGNYSSSRSVFEYTSQAYMWYFNSAGNISATYENGVYTPTGSYPLTTSDVGGIACDLDNLTIKYYKNGVLITTSSLPAGRTWYPISANGSSAAQTYGVTANFGATAFAYPVPVGYHAGWSSGPIAAYDLLIEKKTYPATINTGQFDFATTQGGGIVTFAGHLTYSTSSQWGPQQLFDNTRTNFDWCSSGTIPNTFGEWTFPVPVTMSKIFIVPRLQNDNFPSYVNLIVDGVAKGTYTPTTITSGISGQYIDYTGTAYMIETNASGTVWELNFTGQNNVYIGEIEFWGYAS